MTSGLADFRSDASKGFDMEVYKGIRLNNPQARRALQRVKFGIFPN